jgi:hypothetical protein
LVTTKESVSGRSRLLSYFEAEIDNGGLRLNLKSRGVPSLGQFLDSWLLELGSSWLRTSLLITATPLAGATIGWLLLQSV